MKVSVVTVCYNSQQSILDTLQSVHLQDYPNIEHVVKDGGSKDDTLRIIQGHPSSNVKLVSGADSGIYDAINIGLENTTGDIVGLLHSDDVFTDNHVISDIVRLFEGGADLVYGDLRYVSTDDPLKAVRRWVSGTYRQGSIRRGWMPPHPTVYMKRSLYESVGKYKTDYRIAADYDYMVRLFSRGNLNIGYLNRIIVDMKDGGVSNRSFSNIVKKSREDFLIMRRNGFGSFGIARAMLYKNLSKISQFF